MRKIHGFLWTWYGLWFFQHATNYRSKAALYLRRLHLLFRVQLHTKHDQYTCWYIKTKKKKSTYTDYSDDDKCFLQQPIYLQTELPTQMTTQSGLEKKKSSILAVGSGGNGVGFYYFIGTDIGFPKVAMWRMSVVIKRKVHLGIFFATH